MFPEAATLSDCFDAQSLQTYARLREYLSEVHQTLEPLLKDPSMNKFRFELQKAVTLPVNAISPVSAEHMMDKYRKLHGLLSGRRVEGSSGSVAPSDHPLGGLLVKEIMAKLFVVGISTNEPKGFVPFQYRSTSIVEYFSSTFCWF